MRRPWELAHLQASPAGGTRVYVPFTLPDTSASTFAVLELVGFSSSSPPSSSQSSSSPSLSTSLLHPPAAAGATLCHSQLHPLSSSLPASQSLIATPHPTESSHTASLTHNPTTGRRRAPPIAPDSRGTAAAHGIDAAIHPSSPSAGRAKKSAGSDGPAQPHVVPIQIIENVVHTTSLNFKDVVQQLTGAYSSNKKGFVSGSDPTAKHGTAMPPTPYGKAAIRAIDALSVKVHTTCKGFKSKTPSKLQQRKKSQCNLERFCADDGRGLSNNPLLPSPVTPLASYFNKSCTTITPTASQSSSHSSGVSSPEASLPELNSSDTSISILPYTAIVAEPCPYGQGAACSLSNQNQQDVPLEKSALHGPPLLSLFPEFPAP